MPFKDSPYRFTVGTSTRGTKALRSVIVGFMSSKIVARIAAEAGLPQLLPLLSEGLGLSDLQSLLMNVYQARTKGLREPDLLRKAERGLVTPSKIDARLLNDFERTAFEVANRFEAIELSPVCPLGLNHRLGEIDQNNVLTTIRNTEVLGDPTPAMALECARRRRNPAVRTAGDIRLCSSHRAVRLQPFDLPGYVPHFRLFALVSAGRDRGSHSFECDHLGQHVRCYLELFRALNHGGFSLASPLVEISDTSATEVLLGRAGVTLQELRQSIRAHRLGESERFLAARGVDLPDSVQDPATELGDVDVHRLTMAKAAVFDVLRHEFPEAEFRFNLARLEGLGYYRGLCLRISPMAPDGNRYPVTDGGFTDWTARLLEDRKERFLATGIGTEFVCLRYRSLG